MTQKVEGESVRDERVLGQGLFGISARSRCSRWHSLLRSCWSFDFSPTFGNRARKDGDCATHSEGAQGADSGVAMRYYKGTEGADGGVAMRHSEGTEGADGVVAMRVVSFKRVRKADELWAHDLRLLFMCMYGWHGVTMAHRAAHLQEVFPYINVFTHRDPQDSCSLIMHACTLAHTC